MLRNSLTAVGVAAAIMAMPATADTLRFHSLWQDGDRRAVHTGLLSQSEFDSRAQAFLADGLRLIDIETEVVNGARGFMGLWAEGSGGNFYYVGGGLTALRSEMEVMRRARLRLVDFEVFRDGANLRYVGVFGPGRGRERIVRPLPIAQFLERKELMRTLGLQLRDVEPVVVGGRWRFAALYASEAPPAVFTGFRPRPRFTELRDRMVSDGWELFDFERVPNAEGDDVYVGLWREGDGPSGISRFRSAARHLFFTSQQLASGATPTDAEVKVVRSGEGTTPPPPDDPPDLPQNPPWITIAGTNSQRMVVNFDTPPDHPPEIEVPARWLPSWLPQQDGRVLFPDAHCGFNIRNADRIVWQIPGDDDFDNGVFRSGDVTSTNDLLGGITFSGPIGACADANPGWIFRPPFTAQEQVVSPLPGMRLIIEGVNAELRFQAYDAPVEATFTAFDLFEAPKKDKLVEIQNAFARLAADGEDVPEYCSYVGAYWTAVCLDAGESCPGEQPDLPQCAID